MQKPWIKVFAGFIIIAVIGSATWSWANTTKPQSFSKQVPCERITKDDDTMDLGDSEVTTPCIDGNVMTINSIRNWDGKIVSTREAVLVEKQDEVTSVGTHVEPPELPEPPQFYGSTCNDGWLSPSTGQGTCSHHGGVAY